MFSCREYTVYSIHWLIVVDTKCAIIEVLLKTVYMLCYPNESCETKGARFKESSAPLMFMLLVKVKS